MNLVGIIRKPLITEKSMAQAARNCYVFAVNPQANKGEIKAAIEATYGVDVLSVKTANLPGARRRVGRLRRELVRSPSKKAFVELAKGQTIDVFESRT